MDHWLCQDGENVMPAMSSKQPVDSSGEQIGSDTGTGSSQVHWRFIPIETHDGPTNMAIDEAIMRGRMKGLVPNTIRLYQWSPSTVTIGRHQSVALEVDRDEIDRRGFQLVRRITGGGAVLHAEGGEITYAVIAKISDVYQLSGSLGGNPSPVPAAVSPGGLSAKAARSTNTSIDAIYTTILSVLQKTLNAMMLDTETGRVGCPALFLDGKKFSGNAQRVSKGVILQHGTILLSVDAEVMYSVLKPPEGRTRGRMVRSVKAKVTGIEDYLGRRVEPGEFCRTFRSTLGELLGGRLETGSLTGGELEDARRLREKYCSEEWTLKKP